MQTDIQQKSNIGGTQPNPAAQEEARQKKDTKGWLKILLQFASRCRGRMAVAELFSVLSVFSGLVPYYGIYRIIEAVASAPNDGAVSWDAVLLWTVVGAVAFVAKQLLYAVSTINAHISAYTILAQLRAAIAKRLTNASVGTAQAKSMGRLKDTVVDRIEQIEVPLAHMIPELSANLLLAVVIAVWIIFIDWRLALACLATLPIGLVIMTIGSGGYYKMYGGYLAKQDHVNSVVVEYIKGIRVVKAFNQTTSSYKKYTDAVSDFLAYTIEWMKMARVAMAISMSVLPTTLFGVVPVGVFLYLSGSLTPGEFGLACMLALAVVTPVTYLGSSFNEMNLISFAIADARDFLNLPELAQCDQEAQVTGSDICFSDVHFSYEEGSEVIHGVSLEIPEGSFVALVGPSGSGKSTLARLAIRHWDVDSGSITIGGQDIRDMPLSQLAGLVSYVSQNDYLLDGTLRDNVALGRPSATDEEIRAAIEAAGCEEFVSRLAKGWDTLAGEAGHALSGGERQRICIARAILKDAPIIVFDEATAFADPENEARIQKSVAVLSQGKTLLVIAHRLSTVVQADVICVVNDGRIVTRGTHSQLLETCSLYRDMWQAHIGAASWAAGSGVDEASNVTKGGDVQ